MINTNYAKTYPWLILFLLVNISNALDFKLVRDPRKDCGPYRHVTYHNSSVPGKIAHSAIFKTEAIVSGDSVVVNIQNRITVCAAPGGYWDAYLPSTEDAVQVIYWNGDRFGEAHHYTGATTSFTIPLKTALSNHKWNAYQRGEAVTFKAQIMHMNSDYSFINKILANGLIDYSSFFGGDYLFTVQGNKVEKRELKNCVTDLPFAKITN